MNNLVCTNDLKCVKLLATEEGDKCTVNEECKYGACVTGYCYNFESDHDYPHSCSDDNDCMSKKHKVYGIDSPDVEVPGSCKCGKNPNGTKYCDLFNYDYYGKKYVELIADFVSSSWVNNCNISDKNAMLPCILSYASDDDIEEY